MHSFERHRERLEAAVAGRTPRRLRVDGFRPAAVLIPVLRRGDETRMLFTRRTRMLPHHRGQIAFPGGAIEDGESARDAALREAYEEIGLAPDRVRVLGRLDDQPSVSGFVVSPFVGVVSDPPPSFDPQRSEVGEVFEIALARLLDPRCVREEWRDRTHLPPGAPVNVLEALRANREDFDDATRRYRVWFYDVSPGDDRVVWGLTARILKDLLDRSFTDETGH